MSQNLESNEQMSPAAIDEKSIRDWVDEAEWRMASRHRIKRPFARAILARNWGVSFWTLTNFRRGRLKDLRGATRDRIQAGIIREIEHEIQRLEHEIVLARHCGADLSETKISQASVALEQALAFLEGDAPC